MVDINYTNSKSAINALAAMVDTDLATLEASVAAYADAVEANRADWKEQQRVARPNVSAVPTDLVHGNPIMNIQSITGHHKRLAVLIASGKTFASLAARHPA